MYKVFINNRVLLIAGSDRFKRLQHGDAQPVATYTGRKHIGKAVRTCLAGDTAGTVYLLDTDEKKLWRSFLAAFNIVDAAGGVVLNGKKELLMIYRRGKWDLPKGKVDAGEKNREAAVREVCEETGVCDLHITSHARVTYHSYRLDHRNVLKKTYWYRMQCRRFVRFSVERKEGIERAGWFSPAAVSRRLENAYPLIRDLLARD